MRGGVAKLMRSAFENPKQVPLLGYGETRENNYFPARGKPSTSLRHGCRDTVKHNNTGTEFIVSFRWRMLFVL